MSLSTTSAPAIDVVEVGDPQRLPAAPVISVLMLVYNHGRYLREAVDGVLAQRTDAPFELLISDDGSKDDSLQIALAAQARHPERIRVLHAARNVGMHANHRRLVAAARGEFLAYCEGDDYWHDPEKLGAQLALLQSDATLGAVHTEFAHVAHLDGAWRALPEFHRQHGGPPPQGAVFAALLARNFVQTCTLLVRTALVRAYLASHLPADSYRVVDWPLTLFVAAEHGIAYLDRPMATYRRTPGSATNQGAAADMARALDALRMIDDFAQWRSVDAATLRDAHAEAMRQVRRIALLTRDAARLEQAASWLRTNTPERYSVLLARFDRAVVNNSLANALYRRRRAARAVASERAAYVADKPRVGS